TIDVPKWYLGLSGYQQTAIKEMYNDLRDDFEQGTSFRVEKGLARLGLDPLVSKKKIRTMVKLSRGNDLAFLFFMLEGYYKTARRNGEYSTNEKLLMVAMANVDLMETLRELDRILPPPQLSALDKKRQQRNVYQPPARHDSDVHKHHAVPAGKSKKKRKLPYFIAQTRPKEIAVDYSSRPANHIVQFPFWPLNAPPAYGTPAELRWFQEYKLNPVGRLVKNIVSEAVDKFFNLKFLEGRQTLSRKAAEEFHTMRKSIHGVPQLCGYHQFMLTEAQLAKDQLVVLARDRCLEMLDITMPYRKLRQRRIVAQLERDIDDCYKRYNMKIDRLKVRTLSISKSECMLCQEQYVDLAKPPPCVKQGRALVADCEQLAHTEILDTYVGNRLTGGGVRREPVDFAGELGNCQPVPEFTGVINVEPGQPPQTAPINSGKQRISFSLDARQLRMSSNKKSKPPDQPIAVRYEAKQTRKTFFKAPVPHQPYQFKYKRIFKSGMEKPTDVCKQIAKAFVQALDKGEAKSEHICNQLKPTTSDDELAQLAEQHSGYRLTDSCTSTDDTSDHSTHSRVDHRAEIVNAVVRCVKEIWVKGVTVKRAEMEAAEAFAARKSQYTGVLKFDIDRFDPNDQQLMNTMLQDGFKEMRKNTRYVLASLPDAHKLPVLQEWIKRRYGKQYTEVQMQTNLDQSIKIFEVMSMLQGIPPPADKLGIDRIPESKENYAYFKSAKALGKKVTSTYYKKLNDTYMQHVMACWYAMGNYLCPGGPPRKTFYAYMSANTRDIMR
ncbi:ssp5, partial [Drosophila busckii]